MALLGAARQGTAQQLCKAPSQQGCIAQSGSRPACMEGLGSNGADREWHGR